MLGGPGLRKPVGPGSRGTWCVCCGSVRREARSFGLSGGGGGNWPRSGAVGLRRQLLNKNGPAGSGTGAIHQERMMRSRFRAPCVSAWNAAPHPDPAGPFLLSSCTAAQCPGARPISASPARQPERTGLPPDRSAADAPRPRLPGPTGFLRPCFNMCQVAICKKGLGG